MSVSCQPALIVRAGCTCMHEQTGGLLASCFVLVIGCLLFLT